MNIDITNRQTDVSLEPFTPYIPQIIKAVLDMEKKEAELLSIQFLSDSTMRRYHKKFFSDGSSTDCMSFPIDMDDMEAAELRHLGEILVCPKTAFRYARKNRLPDEAIYSEIALYIIHGALHLLGYDDTSPRLRSIMRKKEAAAMALFLSTTKIQWRSIWEKGIHKQV